MGQTPSQTVGPFFHGALPWAEGADLTEGRAGAVEIFGRITDGNGEPVNDALVEIWQADPEGDYSATAFRGFGRVAVDADGFYRFTTLRPGPVAGPGNRWQAPHIAIGLFARGVLKRLVTRFYFPDADGLDMDPILALVPEDRRRTLIARAEDGGFRLDIALQGEHETVFFDV